MSNGSINDMIWEQVLAQVLTSQELTAQHKSYLRDADCTLDSSSVMLAFPNKLTKEFVDKSPSRDLIRSAMLDITGQNPLVATVVIEREEPAYPPAPDMFFEDKPVVTQPIKQFGTQQLSSQFSATGSSAVSGSGFSAKYTFDSFVVGESNRLAYGAAMSVAEQPAGKYNPLFIYGKSGVGKTHLLCAIENYLRQSHPNLRVLYFPAKDLVTDISNLSIAKNWHEFDKKYHSYDVLLIDDIQFLEGKKESTELVFQLLNDFILHQKQFVLSADRSPKELRMDERMTSRFMSGLTVDIQPPTFETKFAILKNYRDHWIRNSNIGDDVLMYIAENSSTNIREIEGALTRIESYLSLSNNTMEMTVDSAASVLTGYFPEYSSMKPTIKMVMKEVEKYYRVSHDDLVGSKREQKISRPRHVAIYLCRLLTDESYVTIGKEFGNRDHSSIMYANEKIEKAMSSDRKLYDDLQTLGSLIKERVQ